MATSSEATAIGGEESIAAELAGRTYRLMRAFMKAPQDERYLMTRFYGIGFPEKTAEELQHEMRISEAEFEELHRRGLRRLREAERGEGWNSTT